MTCSSWAKRSDELHTHVGIEIGKIGLDMVIGVGEKATLLAKGAARMGTATETFDTVETAAAAISELLQSGDVILIKGSRGMQMERLLPDIKAKFEETQG